jgi:hypothetical protein
MTTTANPATANPNVRYELSQEGLPVGFLVPENDRALRMVVVDSRFRLLDGSRFATVRQAEMTVQRLASFVDNPPRANSPISRAA